MFNASYSYSWPPHLISSHLNSYHIMKNHALWFGCGHSHSHDRSSKKRRSQNTLRSPTFVAPWTTHRFAGILKSHQQWIGNEWQHMEANIKNHVLGKILSTKSYAENLNQSVISALKTKPPSCSHQITIPHCKHVELLLVAVLPLQFLLHIAQFFVGSGESHQGLQESWPMTHDSCDSWVMSGGIDLLN